MAKDASKGFSLIQLLISMLIGMSVLVSMLSLYSLMTERFERHLALGAFLEKWQFTAWLLREAIQSSGFVGDFPYQGKTVWIEKGPIDKLVVQSSGHDFKKIMIKNVHYFDLPKDWEIKDSDILMLNDLDAYQKVPVDFVQHLNTFVDRVFVKVILKGLQHRVWLSVLQKRTYFTAPTKRKLNGHTVIALYVDDGRSRQELLEGIGYIRFQLKKGYHQHLLSISRVKDFEHPKRERFLQKVPDIMVAIS